MTTSGFEVNPVTPVQNRFYWLTMTGGAIFIGVLLWSSIKPYQVYLDLWGRYPSKHEARRACSSWAMRTYDNDDSNRHCTEEPETRQYLGITDNYGYVGKRFRF